MQFDFFDKKVKEAAEQHHPPYDDKAWVKMQQLLDKHMPEEKKRKRRFVFILFFFLLLGGGILLLLTKPWNNPPVFLAEKNNQEKNRQSNTEATVSATPESRSETITGVKLNPEDNKTPTSILSVPVPDKEEKRQASVVFMPAGNPVIQPLRSIKKDKEKFSAKSELLTGSANSWERKENASLTSSITGISQNDKKETESTIEELRHSAFDNSSISSAPISMAGKAVADNKADSINSHSSEKKNTGKNKKENYFSITISGGPDISKAGRSSLSRVNGSYGVGVGYTFGRFTLSSGFYKANKIYSANAEDYKLYYTLPSFIKLTKVNADCKVYEIPLTVTYLVSSRKNNSWSAGLGISSYLMKSEKYENWYQNTNTGYVYPRNYTFTNENKHFFSVLDLSAGYNRKINDVFSLSAMPYVKIPLQGIGEGKVNLKSAGILFTAGIRPFHQAKVSSKKE
jgi:hypothetical protein